MGRLAASAPTLTFPLKEGRNGSAEWGRVPPGQPRLTPAVGRVSRVAQTSADEPGRKTSARGTVSPRPCRARKVDVARESGACRRCGTPLPEAGNGWVGEASPVRGWAARRARGVRSRRVCAPGARRLSWGRRPARTGRRQRPSPGHAFRRHRSTGARWRRW